MSKSALGLFLLAAAFGIAETGRTIQVDVVYNGSGSVDATHKIYVALWDSANMDGAPPAEVKPIDSKTGTATFTDVKTVPAYVSVAYDPTGKWEAQSPPPSGSSLGMYGSHPPTPDPIKVVAGKTTKIKITFDDTNKAP